MTDTVGFVRKLPHQLVEAFRSTLDVVVDADLLVHVVDASGPEPSTHIDAVRQVLTEIGAGQVPELLVFNKADLAPERAAALVARNSGSVGVSAETGSGIDDLLRAIGDRLRSLTNVVELFVPFDRGDVLAVPVTGAYTLAMGSTYNAVPRPAVVLVRDDEARVIRRRETVDDLLAFEA